MRRARSDRPQSQRDRQLLPSPRTTAHSAPSRHEDRSGTERERRLTSAEASHRPGNSPTTIGSDRRRGSGIQSGTLGTHRLGRTQRAAALRGPSTSPIADQRSDLHTQRRPRRTSLRCSRDGRADRIRDARTQALRSTLPMRLDRAALTPQPHRATLPQW